MEKTCVIQVQKACTKISSENKACLNLCPKEAVVQLAEQIRV